MQQRLVLSHIRALVASDTVAKIQPQVPFGYAQGRLFDCAPLRMTAFVARISKIPSVRKEG